MSEQTKGGKQAPAISESSGKVNSSNPRASVAPFDLSTFKLEQATLEVRYPFALQLWDRAGQLWLSIQEKWPDISMVSAEPSKTVFRSGKTTLAVEAEVARITTVEPSRSLEDFARIAKVFLSATAQNLKITVFKRIGFRTIYFREYKERLEAANAFFSLGLVRVPVGKKFEVSDAPVASHYSMRWESDVKGVSLQVRSETRKLDFEPPPELVAHIAPVHEEKNGIVFDLDYYTIGTAEPGQIDAEEWIKHALHVIFRDSGYVFEH